MRPNVRKHIICFDVGNVLMELGPPIESWLEPQDLSKFKSLIHDYSIGNITSANFFENLIAISKYPRGTIPVERWFVDKRLIAPFPGAIDLLWKLSAQDVEISLFSNTNEAHWNRISKYSFRHDHAFVSFLMKKKKPDLGAFKDLERSLQVSGKEIIFFDDSLINIETAMSLGWSGYLAFGSNPVEGIKAILNNVYNMNI